MGQDLYRVSLKLDLDESGRLVLASPTGAPLDPRLERAARIDQREKLESWLDEKCAEINGTIERLSTLHVETPRPDIEHRLAEPPFPVPSPIALLPEFPSFWERLFPWMRRAREQRDMQAAERYQRELARWEEERARHVSEWEARRRRVEEDRLTSIQVMHELLEESLQCIVWPRETVVSFEVTEDGSELRLDVDLPEIEDLPRVQASVAARGLKLNLRELSDARLRGAYASHIHGVVFLVVGHGFSVLPTVQTITCSGFSQRVDPATGVEKVDYLISLRVKRNEWSRIDFGNLVQVDPVAALEQFERRCDRTTTSVLTAITPIDSN